MFLEWPTQQLLKHEGHKRLSMMSYSLSNPFFFFNQRGLRLIKESAEKGWGTEKY